MLACIRKRAGQSAHDLTMKGGKFAAFLQRSAGGIVQQCHLKHARHHQGFVLVEAQQMMAVNLRDLHNICWG